VAFEDFCGVRGVPDTCCRPWQVFFGSPLIWPTLQKAHVDDGDLLAVAPPNRGRSRALELLGPKARALG